MRRRMAGRCRLRVRRYGVIERSHESHEEEAMLGRGGGVRSSCRCRVEEASAGGGGRGKRRQWR